MTTRTASPAASDPGAINLPRATELHTEVTTADELANLESEVVLLIPEAQARLHCVLAMRRTDTSSRRHRRPARRRGLTPPATDPVASSRRRDAQRHRTRDRAHYRGQEAAREVQEIVEPSTSALKCRSRTLTSPNCASGRGSAGGAAGEFDPGRSHPRASLTSTSNRIAIASWCDIGSTVSCTKPCVRRANS
jgi:hypothetical protein